MIGKNSKIYVSGHNGLVGSAIVRRLKFFGYKKIITKNKEELDLRNQNSVESFFNKYKPEETSSKEIFSENIVGAGSIREGYETDQLCNMAMSIIQFYMLEMNNPQYQKLDCLDTKEAQNKYCRNQKMNKMLHSSILAMGVPEERKNQYVEEVLFEEV